MIVDYRDVMNKLLEEIFEYHIINRDKQKKVNKLIEWQINSNLRSLKHE